jgi:hypothetical protein
MSDNLDTSHAPVPKFGRSSISVKETGTGSISITRHQNTIIEILKVKPSRRRPVHSIQVEPSSNPHLNPRTLAEPVAMARATGTVTYRIA